MAQWVKNLSAIQESQEIQVWSLGWEDLKEEMATHSSILAWIIPWTEEPGRLQSMGSQELDMTEQINTQISFTIAKVKMDILFFSISQLLCLKLDAFSLSLPILPLKSPSVDEQCHSCPSLGIDVREASTISSNTETTGINQECPGYARMWGHLSQRVSTRQGLEWNLIHKHPTAAYAGFVLLLLCDCWNPRLRFLVSLKAATLSGLILCFNRLDSLDLCFWIL